MNRTEKIICFLLGAVLAWYIFFEAPKQKNVLEPQAEATVESGKNAANPKTPEIAAPKAEQPEIAEQLPAEPEKTLRLENDDVIVELSSHGAVVKKVVLKKYAVDCGDVGADNPAVEMDFSASPLGALKGVKGLRSNESYKVEELSSNYVCFASSAVKRKVSIDSNYRITYEDKFSDVKNSRSSLSLGLIRMGESKNDLLSVDSMSVDPVKGKDKVVHHGDDDSPLKAYLVGGTGGCSGSSSAAGIPAKTTVDVPGTQKYLALKNRFFVSALCSSSSPIEGFAAEISRNMKLADYRPESISAAVHFGESQDSRSTVFYVGPKKQSLLWDLGMADVMEFGMWRYLCYPLVWVLNLFHDWVPNYGIAIILLTILVRIIFWPLTHKSTVGMKKMQEIQPKLKALQAKFKDNPQRLQQETFLLYKTEKVNPLSSCLPMLIQIPVFIALFNVLRSAVELRYAPFLWIADLSEPEGLFAAYLPFGGLNLLPIMMAVTTGLQSAFTPSSGDKSQQRMMMVFMPVMMLVMFYSFPSALSLYWFLSNIFSIVQMWLIRRSAAKKNAEVLTPEVIDPPVTRQMRRHGN